MNAIENIKKIVRKVYNENSSKDSVSIIYDSRVTRSIMDAIIKYGIPEVNITDIVNEVVIGERK